LLEQNDEWLLRHRYMQIEGMAELKPPLIDADPAKLPPMAADVTRDGERRAAAGTVFDDFHYKLVHLF
jgi:hypothetical protein